MSFGNSSLSISETRIRPGKTVQRGHVFQLDDKNERELNVSMAHMGLRLAEGDSVQAVGKEIVTVKQMETSR